MDLTTRLLTMGAAGAAGAEKLYVEDVFSTYLYTGNGSTQTITNGIDLSGKGGLVWIKDRDNANNHNLFDTARGTGKLLRSSLTNAEATDNATVTAFTSSGFNLGDSLNYGTNYSGTRHASWTFRKAAKFFDVVTWSGDGSSSRAISHNLGSVPGCIIVKATNVSGEWETYHRGLNGGTNPQNCKILLNSTAAQVGPTTGAWAQTAPTSTVFYVNGNANTNDTGKNYVAYLFAHDAGGFGDSGNESVVKCGSYTGNGSTSGPQVDLGWEPQWVMIKRTSGAAAWYMYDNMRGVATGGIDAWLQANASSAENASFDYLDFNATGFKLTTTSNDHNGNGDTYIYIAIRRGPMKTPTDATKVLANVLHTGSSSAQTITGVAFSPDYIWSKDRSAGNNGWHLDRLRGLFSLDSSTIGAEQDRSPYFGGFTQDGFRLTSGGHDLNRAGSNHYSWALRRAPGFFDVVAYGPGSGTTLTVNHNLGVLPELVIIKSRSSGGQWIIQNGSTNYGFFNANAFNAGSYLTTLTSTAFSLTVDGNTYIAYLFASCPGVSKVGSYTGSNSTLNIDCGFTNGARFVLIKRTNSGGFGDWFVFDSARGIVSGNDPYLALNRTDAENFFGSADAVDSYPAGFSLPGGTLINESGGEFIYLAIA